MRAAVTSTRLGKLGLGLAAALAFGIGGTALAGPPDSAKAEGSKARADRSASGYEIFNREWMPDDPRGHGGDGLGPVFNDSSCVACHNSGGSGGAGPVSKNIDILSATRNVNFMAPPTAVAPVPVEPENAPDPAAGFAARPAQAVAQGGACPPPTEAQMEPLFTLHPGFRTSKTVVLHKFGTDPNYDAFRAKVLGNDGPTTLAPANQAFVTTFNPTSALQVPTDNIIINTVPQATFINGGMPVNFSNQANNNAVFFLPNGQQADARTVAAMNRMRQAAAAVAANRSGMSSTSNIGPFTISRSQRNPTPLFGLGLIDSIPESAIVAVAKQQAKETPQVAGRPARVKDGRIGRLGWKGQTANSEDFVLNACAVEVGLEVPGHNQAITPQAPRYKGPGLDLTAEECASLVSYVRSLPRPVERASSGAVEAKFLAAGKSAFNSIGCASCHVAKLGEVEAVYTDLLLHDMGDEMADSGSYDGSSDEGTDEPLVPLLAENGQPQQQIAGPNGQPRAPKSARKREWRTPALWGFRDSGPYLHDGRAQTLEQAVAVHGGQGADSALKFFLLSPTERMQVEAFLKSLVAPGNDPDRREIARAGE